MLGEGLKLHGIGRQKATSVRIEEIKPTPHRSGSEGTLDGQNEGASFAKIYDATICSVCKSNESRYSCPRCEIPYCSLTCYKKHGNRSDDDSTSICTENFYQSRVTDALKLQVKEKREETLQILNREFNESMDNNNKISLLSEEGALRLMDAIENNDKDTIQQIFESHEHLRRAFENAALSGQLNDWIMDPWYPWWRTELASSVPQLDDSDYIHEDELFDLDERLVHVKPFCSVRPKNQTVSPDLRFNLVDILLGTLVTLRSFHGLQNAKESPTEATEMLINLSAVLCHDSRFTSVEEVLLSFLASTAKPKKRLPPAINSSIILEDLTLVLLHRRTALRGLFEAHDILEAGETQATSKKTKQKIKQLTHKLSYFTSWLNSENVDLDSVCRSIHIFLDQGAAADRAFN